MSQPENPNTPDDHGGANLPANAPVELPIPRLPRPPFWLVGLALVSVVVTWLPLALIARARVSTSAEPRIAIAQDMGTQPKYREQQVNHEFADDREMRPKIPGTVSRSDLEDDDDYFRGFTRVYNPYDGKWSVVFTKGFPARVKVTQALLQRGEARFNIYCYVCHGLDGSGQGPVNQRALLLTQNGVDGMSWVSAADLTGNSPTSDAIRAQPNGKIFNTITNGIRTMPSYGLQIPVDDRWAIIAYVRTLQFSQKAPASVLPADKLGSLQGQ
jgi:mono/diheme cytochrome c family protein